MSEVLEQLFKAFLEENSVDFKIKDEIYSIAFEKPYDQIFGEKVKGTFNEKLAQEKKISFFGHGSFVISKIISLYADEKGLFALQILSNINGLEAVQDKIDELHVTLENGNVARYKVEDQKIQLALCSLRLEVQAAMQKDTQFLTMLFYEDHKDSPILIKKLEPIVNKEELLTCGFQKASKNTIDSKKIKSMIKSSQKTIEKHFSKELKAKEKQHEDFIKEQLKIKEDHFEALMKETNQIVDQARWRIEEKRQMAMKARSFEKMYERGAEKKKEEKKLKAKEKEADAEKEKIRREMLSELEEIKSMKFKAHAEIINLGIFEVQAFTIAYEHGKSFVYIPELQELQEL